MSKGLVYLHVQLVDGRCACTALSSQGALLAHAVTKDRHKSWLMVQSQLYTMDLVPNPCNPSQYETDSKVTII